MRTIFIIVLIGLLGRSIPADAAVKTVSDLFENCKKYELILETSDKIKTLDSHEFTDAAQCSSYIWGAIDYEITLAAQLGKSLKQGILFGCSPKGSTLKQYILVFNKWARENPEQLHQMTILGLQEAFSKAFPCPEDDVSK